MPAVAPPAAPIAPAALTGVVELRGVEYRYPGASAPVLADISFIAQPGRGHRDHRLDRRRQDDAARADPAARRSDRGHRARRRRRRARARARGAVGADRRRAAARRICSRARSRRTCASATPTRPTTSCGPRSRSRRRRTSSRRCRSSSRRRSRRAAPTSRAASASGSRSRARCCASRRVFLFDDSFSALDLATEARLRAALAPRTANADGDRRRPARREHPRRRPDPRARRRQDRRHAARTRELVATLPDLRRDRDVADRGAGGGGVSSDATPAPPASRRRAPDRCAARWAASMGPPQKAKTFGASARRLLGRLAPRAPR